MRPPLNAGENASRRLHGIEPCVRFNEAPAERGGKQRRAKKRPPQRASFNEAPAERGGKPLRRDVVVPYVSAASMRPPLNAGENSRRFRAAAQT